MNPIKLNKRHIVLASVIFALATAVGINYWLSPENGMFKKNEIISNAPDDTTVYANSDSIENKKDVEKIKSFFAEERDQKEKYRKQVSDSSSNNQDYLKNILQEDNIESIIKGKMDDNLIDCIARIGADGCNVIVSFKTDLTKENVYKIKEVVKKQTGFNNDKIKIIEKK